VERLPTFIIFLLLTQGAIAQNKQFKVDTFYKADALTSLRLLVSSDTSFFLASSNCTEANITKGKWKQSNGKLTLIPDPEEKIIVTPSIENSVVSKVTDIKFRVLDYFKTPIGNYTVIFFDNDMKEYEHSTDESGHLSVPKNKYVAYLTIHEYNNMNIGTDVTNTVHFLWNGFSDVELTMNYPKQILRDRPNVYPFRYKEQTFIKGSKGLTSTTSRLTLKKL
jgi:hypothetical protein